MSGSTTPNITDFTTFLQNVVGIDPLYLPTSSATITYAFTVSMATVNQSLAAVPMPSGSSTIYQLAVYNLGADLVINFANDQPDRTFFQDLRKQFGISTFVPGVIASSGNAPTSQSTLNPEFMKTLTFGDLQNMKTPYGRQYLFFAQQFGSLWGLT